MAIIPTPLEIGAGASAAPSGNSFRVVIAATIDSYTQYFDLDLCRDRTVQSSMTIAQYPVQNGMTVSDHMYRNPTIVTINGTFSLNSKRTFDHDNIYTRDHINLWNRSGKLNSTFFGSSYDSQLGTLGVGSRLQDIQKIFDYIQRNGIMCKIMMVEKNPQNNSTTFTLDQATRFKSYDNMVLRDITWVEKLNSMDFSFTFQEVITAANLLGEFVWFDYDTLYPSPMMPASKTLGELMQGDSGLVPFVLKTLMDSGYIEAADAKVYTIYTARSRNSFKPTTVYTKYTAQESDLSEGLSWALSNLENSDYFTAWAMTGFGTGGLIGLIIAAIYLGINPGKNSTKKQLNAGFNLIRDFQQYIDEDTLELKDDKSLDNLQPNTGDIARLQQLLNYVEDSVNKALSAVKVYQITSDPNDNLERQVTITAGDETVVAQINKSSGAQLFSLSLYDFEGKRLPQYCGSWPIESDLSALSRNNGVVYVTRDLNYEIYLFCPEANDAITPDSTKKKEIESRLSSYYFIVSYGKLEDNMKKVTDTIINALKNQGYTE